MSLGRVLWAALLQVWPILLCTVTATAVIVRGTGWELKGGLTIFLLGIIWALYREERERRERVPQLIRDLAAHLEQQAR